MSKSYNERILRLSNLLIRKLSLELAHFHTGYVTFPVTSLIQIIGQLCILYILLGDLNLSPEVFEGYAIPDEYSARYPLYPLEIGTAKLMETLGFCVGLL